MAEVLAAAAPAELSLGVLTAIIGTPVFLFLIDRARRNLALAGW